MPLLSKVPGSFMSDSSSATPDFAPRAGRGVTAATRQRLDAVYARAKACVERGDHDYGHDLLTQCVAEDPGNLLYAQTFRANISAKHAGTGKKSSRFASLVGKTGRGPVAKAAGRGAWTEAFTAACQALKKNPIDLPVLREMARGCGVLGHTELQLFYLRWALDLDLHDVETNRDAAEALATAGQFDQAIACWQRVLKSKPDDEEARKAISRLSVEQTLQQGGYNPGLLKPPTEGEEAPSLRVADLANKGAPIDAGQQPAAEAATQEELVAAVEADAKDLRAAADLGRRLLAAGRTDEALKVVRRSLKASDTNDTPEHAQLEDLQLQIARSLSEAAQAHAQADRSPDALKLAKQRLANINELEAEVYAARVAREPGDARSLFELGLRHKRAGRHREAIKSLQAARADTRRQAEVQLHLGECFQHIEQFKLATSSYEAAVAAADGAGEETRKLALYRAGVLAMGLGDLDRAENRLTELAGLDFGYKDVGDRLDKIAALRKNA